jgi:hypothetical protein
MDGSGRLSAKDRHILGTPVTCRDSASGAKGTRTPDPLLAKQVLYQLSYSPSLQAF